jgi:integrase
MKGTIIRHQPKRGRKTFGYSLFLGRDENGKQLRQLKRGFKREKDAQDALRKAIEELEHAPAVERKMPTFGEFVERWHSECVKRECAPKTAERAYELSQYAVRIFGGVPLDKLDTMQLATALNQLADRGGRKTEQFPKGKPLAPKTVRHIAFNVQSCLQQACDWEIISNNPMLKVKKPKVAKREPRVVDRHGFDRLLEKAEGTSVYAVVVTAMATGARRGELCGLEWTDINWHTGVLTVSKSLEQTKQGLRIKSTKNGETRRFPIPVDVLEVLRDHQREQDRHRELCGPGYHNLNLIFARPDGYYYSPDKLGTRIGVAMRRAGLSGVSLHSLRHSHASQLLSEGVPITAVSQRLGHRSPNVTLGIYSHCLPDDAQAAAQAWNQALGGVLEKSRRRLANGGLSLVITEGCEERGTHIKSAS